MKFIKRAKKHLFIILNAFAKMYHISRKKHPTITQTIEGKERVTGT
jgi:hypothetical protein